MENNRMKAIEIIQDFLENWKQEAKKYYINLRQEDEDKKQAVYTQRRSEEKLSNEEKLAQVLRPEVPSEITYRRDFENGGYKAIKRYNKCRSDEMYCEYKEWKEANVTQHMQSEFQWSEKDFLERLEKMLDKEVIKKLNTLVSKVEKKGGTIIRPLTLEVSASGELNGLICCENKSVLVETIYAGGYNIQCLHYRTLVK